MLADKALFRSNPDGLQGKATKYAGKNAIQAVCNGCESSFQATLLLTDLVEHHSAEGERSFHADRLGSLASWCAKLPFLFKEDAEYEV